MGEDAGKILVAGASGFVGGAVVARLAGNGRPVVGVSRRAPTEPVAGADHVALDLLDAEACRSAGPRLSDITGLVYAAVNETPGDLVASWTDPEHAGRNGAMFANLLDALLLSAPGLRHVTLVHGTKAYAPHRPGPTPVPLRESLPRPDFDDFYFRQEDRLWKLAADHDIGWTVLRAQIVVGGGRGSNLNGLLALCVMAELRRAAGLDLPSPRSPSGELVLEMTDVELLARAIVWAGDAPAARNRIFNVTNGDVFTWRDMWPVIAGEIGLPAGPSTPFSVRAEIAERAGDWAQLVRRHKLDLPEDPLVYLGESAALSDFALNGDRNVVTSTIAIRQAGFQECVDSAESVVKWIRRWRAHGMLPPR